MPSKHHSDGLGARAPDHGRDLSARGGFGRRCPGEARRSSLVLGGPDDDPGAGEEGVTPAPAGRHEIRLSAEDLSRVGVAHRRAARDADLLRGIGHGRRGGHPGRLGIEADPETTWSGWSNSSSRHGRRGSKMSPSLSIRRPASAWSPPRWTLSPRRRSCWSWPGSSRPPCPDLRRPCGIDSGAWRSAASSSCRSSAGRSLAGDCRSCRRTSRVRAQACPRTRR